MKAATVQLESLCTVEPEEAKPFRGLLSAVVVSFNTREHTLRCLEALCSGTYPEIEVYVVDNGSVDGSVEAIEGLARSSARRLHLIQLGMNIGFGAACNRGVRASTGEFVALVNSDAFVEPDALERLVRRTASCDGAALVGPRLLNPDGSLQPSKFPFPTPGRAWLENLGLIRLARFAGRNSPRQEWLSGACLLFRREVWTSMGGFDEAFFLYAEETDLQKRLRDAGCAILCEENARVVHLGGGSGLSRRDAVREHFFTGADRYMLKHFGASGALLFRAATAIGAALRLIPFALFQNGRVAEQFWILRRQLGRSLPERSPAWEVPQGPRGRLGKATSRNSHGS